MTSDTLFEVTEVAVVRHPRHGVLVVHSDQRAWHFPDSTLEVGDAWDESLLEAVAATTGLTNVRINALLEIQTFGPGEVGERPQYGVFFLCHTDSADVRPGGEIDDFDWVTASSELIDRTLFHPRIEDLVTAALKSPSDEFI